MRKDAGRFINLMPTRLVVLVQKFPFFFFPIEKEIRSFDECDVERGRER